MQSVAHGMIEILMPVRTFLRSGLTVLEKESPHFREGRKSIFGVNSRVQRTGAKSIIKLMECLKSFIIAEKEKATLGSMAFFGIS